MMGSLKSKEGRFAFSKQAKNNPSHQTQPYYLVRK
jgi:hypothetical protein